MIASNWFATQTVAVILAGGEGRRLGALTDNICKPALPFGGTYRTIDFTLANCVNSGIRRIGVATQHKPQVLHEHLDRVWTGAARRHGEFIKAWPATERAPASGYRGTADAVLHNLEIIERLGCSFVLVLAGDHVYKMDYRPMIEYHYRRSADLTIACVEVDASEAYRFGIVSADRFGRVRGFVEKPAIPAGLATANRVLASMGVYVFSSKFLATILKRDVFSRESRYDFGGDILPNLAGGATLLAYPFREIDGDRPAYWRDVGTPASYWRAHLELFDVSPGLRLDDPAWPLRTASGPPRFATLRDSTKNSEGRGRLLAAKDCAVEGSVDRSVLFENVRVSKGAQVENCIVLPGAVVGKNCRLRNAIVDSGCNVPAGTVIESERRSDSGDEELQPAVITARNLSPDFAASYA